MTDTITIHGEEISLKVGIDDVDASARLQKLAARIQELECFILALGDCESAEEAEEAEDFYVNNYEKLDIEEK